MKQKIKELLDKYCNAENKLTEKLNELERAGNVCNCDDRETIKFIHEGEFDEVIEMCLNCGGYIE